MGLIKAATGAAGGTLAISGKSFFIESLCRKKPNGKRKKANYRTFLQC